jgi:hypothetical protein
MIKYDKNTSYKRKFPSFQVARAVKVSQVDTPYFTIITPSNAYQKVAPGVALIFRIQFKPEEQRVLN